jgi:diguanylate cyclase (GGDEF)-like protein
VVLHEVAQVVAQRAMPKGITCRYGGEEIVVFLPNVSLKEARQVAQEIRKAVSQLKLKIAQKRLSTTVSIGVAGYEKNSLPVKVLIARADKALYRAKRAGRNRVAIVRVNY